MKANLKNKAKHTRKEKYFELFEFLPRQKEENGAWNKKQRSVFGLVCHQEDISNKLLPQNLC